MRFSPRLAAVALAALGALLPHGPAAGADAALPVAEGEAAHRRLSDLFARTEGAAPKVPTSPRFAALREPGSRGTRLVVGWLLPGLDAADRSALDELVAALGPSGDGHLPAPLAAFGPRLTVAVSVEAIRDVPLLCIDLALPRAGASKDLELAVLRAVSDLAQADTSTALLARRHLTPLARAVIEVHSPRAAAVAPHPKVHVVKAGDTLATLARHFGVSEKALLETNRLETRRLRLGQKLVIPR